MNKYSKNRNPKKKLKPHDIITKENSQTASEKAI